MGVLDRFRARRPSRVLRGAEVSGFRWRRGSPRSARTWSWLGETRSALWAAKAALAETGRSVEILSADVGEPTASEAAARRVVEQWGPVDILINNVGGRRIDVPTEELALADWQRIIDLNLTSAFVWSKVVGGAMLRRGWGRVINVASISGLIANRGIVGRTLRDGQGRR